MGHIMQNPVVNPEAHWKYRADVAEDALVEIYMSFDVTVVKDLQYSIQSAWHLGQAIKEIRK